MFITESRFRLTIGAALHGLVAMSIEGKVRGAAPSPSIVAPPPSIISTVSTTTDAIEEDKPVPAAHAHHRHVHYAMHRRAEPVTSDETITTDTTVAPVAATTVRKSTETTTTVR